MIDFLSNWIEQIAIAVVIVSIFEMILPSGKIKKYIKIILGVYVVFAMISPFVDSKALYSFDFSKLVDEYSSKLDAKEKYEYGNNVNIGNNLDEIYKNTFEKQITKTVQNRGYDVYKCSVYGNFNSKEDLGIRKILIILKSKKNLENDNENIEENKTNEIKIDGVQKIQIGIINKIKGNEKDKEDNEKTQEITTKDITDLKEYLSTYYELDKSIFEIQRR